MSFAVYRADKNAAIDGSWRVSEGTLHFIDLAFSIVGGLLTQGLLRHKTSKPSFAAVTNVLVAMHAAILVLLLMGYRPLDLLAALATWG